MSSHREAPEISKDPVADNTDTYAFVSPDRPHTVTIITNYVPLEDPPGGPNFFEFGDDVRYSIYVDNDHDGLPEIEYQFKFETRVRNPNTFLYNTGQIRSLNSPNWNRRQFYQVSRIDHKHHGRGHHRAQRHVLARNLLSPPCNIGPRSTPNYQTVLANRAVHGLPGGAKVFAGQRNEGFFVDLGSIFDLATLRPLQNLHLISTSPTMSVDATATLNVHTIAIQVPIRQLTRDRSVPSNPMAAKSVLGIWGAASRRKTRVIDRANDERAESGPWVQVSRLGNPLFNEVVVPMGEKDRWNALHPAADKAFAKYVAHPELAKLLPVLYPGQFPHLAALKAKRSDLLAILLTGLPKGIIPGFQNNTGSVLADMLRLNVAIPPTTSNPKPLGILGGDLAGFPNGRRVFDDVVTVELKAVAGATYPLVNPSYTPDSAVGALDQGLSPGNGRYQSEFPYLGTPHDGYSTGT
jgi:Domain of unknown function (DUF4331)